MPDIPLGKLVAKLALDPKEFDTGIARAQQHIARFGRESSKLLTTPLIAFGGVAVKLAADAETVSLKLRTSFGANAAAVEKFAQSSAQTLGRGLQGLRRDLADTAQALAGLGLSGRQLEKTTVQVTELATRLADIQGIAPGDALQSLLSAFGGSSEGLRKLNIFLRESEVNFRAMAQTGKRSAETLTANERAAAVLSLVLEKTARAEQAAAGFTDSFGKQFRALRENAVDVGTSFGQVLLPAASRLLREVAPLVQEFAALSIGQRESIVLVAGLAAALGPAAAAVGFLTAGIVRLGAAMKALAVAALANPVATLVTAFAALGAVVAADLASGQRFEKWLEAQGKDNGAFGWLAERLQWIESLFIRIPQAAPAQTSAGPAPGQPDVFGDPRLEAHLRALAILRGNRARRAADAAGGLALGGGLGGAAVDLREIDAAAKQLATVLDSIETDRLTLGMGEFAKRTFEAEKTIRALAPALHLDEAAIQALLGVAKRGLDEIAESTRKLEAGAGISGVFQQLGADIHGIGLDEFARRAEEGALAIQRMGEAAGFSQNEIDSLRQAHAGMVEDLKARTKEVASAFKFNIGDELSGRVRELSRGLLAGTREGIDVLESFRDISQSIVSDMFAAMIRDKLDFDLEFKANFGSELPGLVKDFAKGASDSLASIEGPATGEGLFSGIADSLRSFATNFASGFKSLFANLLSGLGSFVTSAGGLIVGLFGAISAAAGNTGGALRGVLAGLSALLPLASIIGSVGPAPTSQTPATSGAEAPLIATQHGGITTGPTRILAGDNPSGVEAIVPLERFDEFFGRLGGGAHVRVEIDNRASELVSFRQVGQRQSGLATVISLAADLAHGRVVDEILRGGATGQAIQGTYGVSRRGV